jgi:hypothetical protein
LLVVLTLQVLDRVTLCGCRSDAVIEASLRILWAKGGIPACLHGSKEKMLVRTKLPGACRPVCPLCRHGIDSFILRRLEKRYCFMAWWSRYAPPGAFGATRPPGMEVVSRAPPFRHGDAGPLNTLYVSPVPSRPGRIVLPRLLVHGPAVKNRQGCPQQTKRRLGDRTLTSCLLASGNLSPSPRLVRYR